MNHTLSSLRALDSAEAQQLFRTCLDALARPGTIGRLNLTSLPEQYAAVHLPMLALVDLMTPISTLDDSPHGHCQEISIVTGAPLVARGAARWILAAEPVMTDEHAEQLRELSTGTVLSPELGAVVCQQVDGLGSSGTTLTLRGPGVAGETTLRVAGLGAGYVRVRNELCMKHPAGIDLILVAPDGAVAAIPRTSEIVVSGDYASQSDTMEASR